MPEHTEAAVVRVVAAPDGTSILEFAEAPSAGAVEALRREIETAAC